MRRSSSFLAWGLTLASAWRSSWGRRSPTIAPQDPPPQQQQEPPAGEQPGRGGRGNQPAAPRPYAQVITSAAKTDEGIFKVHRVGDTLYFEIPKGELDKDFVWNVVDQEDDDRRRLRRPERQQPRRALGEARRSDPAPEHGLQHHLERRRRRRAGRRERELPGDHPRASGRGLRVQRRRRRRRDRAGDGTGRRGRRRRRRRRRWRRRAGVLRGQHDRRPRHGRDAVVPRTRRLVPREHQYRSDADVHERRRRALAAGAAGDAAPAARACAARAAPCSSITA